MKILLAVLILYFLFYYQNHQKKISNPRKNFVWGDPYAVLEIDPSSSEDQIKQAFRELSKKNHPDLVSHMSEDFQKLAEEKLKKINWAYQEIRKVRNF